MGNSGLSKFLLREGLLSKQDCQLISRETGHVAAAFAKGVVALGIFTEDELAKYISDRTRLPIVPRERLLGASARVMGAIDVPLLEKLEVLPIELNGNTLVVAMADPLDEEVRQQLDFFVDYTIQPVVTTTTAIHSTLKGVVTNFAPQRSSFQDLLEKHVRQQMPVRDIPNPSRRNPSAAPGSSHAPRPIDEDTDIVDDLDDVPRVASVQESDDSDLDLETSDGASTSSADLDDFSLADDDVAISEGDDLDGSTNLDDVSADLGGSEQGRTPTSALDGDIDLEGIEDQDPFDDPTLDDPDAPPRETKTKSSPPKKAAIDPMALWSDESALGEAESEFDVAASTDDIDSDLSSSIATGALSDSADEDVSDFDFGDSPAPKKPQNAGKTPDFGDDFDAAGDAGSESASIDDVDDLLGSGEDGSDSVSIDDADDLFGGDIGKPSDPHQSLPDDEFDFDTTPVGDVAEEPERVVVRAKADDPILGNDGEDLMGNADDLGGTAAELGDDLDADDLPDLETDSGPSPSENSFLTSDLEQKTIVPLEKQDASDLGIGYLNHAAAKMALTTTAEEAKLHALEGLAQAGIACGFLYKVTEAGPEALAHWNNNKSDIEISQPPKSGLTPALSKLAAENPGLSWSPAAPNLTKGLQGAPNTVAMSCIVQHPKGTKLLAIAMWPKASASSAPLNEAAASTLRQLSKKLGV